MLDATQLRIISAACLAGGGFLAALCLWRGGRGFGLLGASVLLHAGVLGLVFPAVSPPSPAHHGTARFVVKLDAPKPPPKAEPALAPPPEPAKEPQKRPERGDEVPEPKAAPAEPKVPEAPPVPAPDPQPVPAPRPVAPPVVATEQRPQPQPVPAPSAGPKPDNPLVGKDGGGDVVILLDRSASTGSNGLLDRLKGYLTAYLEGKGRPKRVALAFFNSKVEWLAVSGHEAVLQGEPAFIDVTDENVKRIVERLADIDPGGATDPGPPLSGALQLEPDTVYLITDNDDSRSKPAFTWKTPKGRIPLLNVVEFGPQDEEPEDTPSKELIKEFGLKIGTTARHAYYPAKAKP